MTLQLPTSQEGFCQDIRMTQLMELFLLVVIDAKKGLNNNILFPAQTVKNILSFKTMCWSCIYIYLCLWDCFAHQFDVTVVFVRRLTCAGEIVLPGCCISLCCLSNIRGFWLWDSTWTRIYLFSMLFHAMVMVDELTRVVLWLPV